METATNLVDIAITFVETAAKLVEMAAQFVETAVTFLETTAKFLETRKLLRRPQIFRRCRKFLETIAHFTESAGKNSPEERNFA